MAQNQQLSYLAQLLAVDTSNNVTISANAFTINAVALAGNIVHSGTATFNANLTIASTAGIIANGSIGVAGQVLVSNGSSTYWGVAGATGGGTDQIFWLNGQTVASSYTIPANTNAGTFGPVTIANTANVTISNNSVWTIV